MCARNVKSTFQPETRRVSRTFARILRGFRPLPPYLLLEVTIKRSVVLMTFRRVVRRKVENTCFSCCSLCANRSVSMDVWDFRPYFTTIFPLPPYLLFGVTTFLTPWRSISNIFYEDSGSWRSISIVSSEGFGTPEVDFCCIL